MRVLLDSANPNSGKLLELVTDPDGTTAVIIRDKSDDRKILACINVDAGELEAAAEFARDYAKVPPTEVKL